MPSTKTGIKSARVRVSSAKDSSDLVAVIHIGEHPRGEILGGVSFISPNSPNTNPVFCMPNTGQYCDLQRVLASAWWSIEKIMKILFDKSNLYANVCL